MASADTRLPTTWPQVVKSAVLQVVSLAHWAIIHARSWAADSRLQRVRLAGELERARNEISVLREILRLKDARMRRIPPHRRPQYRPTERMAILELRAAQGWTAARTAETFLIDPGTVATWMKRIDEEGPGTLVQVSAPVNRFPAFVAYVVRRLKVLCPTLGRRRMAQMLARAGLHLAASTIRRMIARGSGRTPRLGENAVCEEIPKPAKPRVVTAKYPNHVWHVDLTAIPTSAGFWTAWLPFSLPQVWPFCWWMAAVVDHYSRKALGFALFKKLPRSVDVRAFLGRAIARAGSAPRHLICDKGCQFDCDGFRTWCKRKKIKPRFGAVGRYGSIAIIERFFRSAKEEFLRSVLVPLHLDDARKHLTLYAAWYNQHRPHQALGGATPDEVYFGIPPANRNPRIEPRLHWPADSPCASPQAPPRAERPDNLELVVSFLDEEKRLPVVEIKTAA